MALFTERLQRPFRPLFCQVRNGRYKKLQRPFRALLGPCFRVPEGLRSAIFSWKLFLITLEKEQGIPILKIFKQFKTTLLLKKLLRMRKTLQNIKMIKSLE